MEAAGAEGADGGDCRRGLGGKWGADAGGVPEPAGRSAHHGCERRRGAGGGHRDDGAGYVGRLFHGLYRSGGGVPRGIRGGGAGRRGLGTVPVGDDAAGVRRDAGLHLQRAEFGPAVHGGRREPETILQLDGGQFLRLPVFRGRADGWRLGHRPSPGLLQWQGAGYHPVRRGVRDPFRGLDAAHPVPVGRCCRPA